MGQGKRIRRGVAGWRKLVTEQSSSGMSVSKFCQQLRINATLFRRWQARLGCTTVAVPSGKTVNPAVAGPAPFIDLGDLRGGAPRLEVRLDLGDGLILSIARR